MNAPGLRYNGADGLYLHDVIFRQNDDGLTGIGNARVEFAEFDHNGTPQRPPRRTTCTSTTVISRFATRGFTTARRARTSIFAA